MLSDGDVPLGSSCEKCWVSLTDDARLQLAGGGQEVAFSDLCPGSFVKIDSPTTVGFEMTFSHVTVITNPSKPAAGPGKDSRARVPQGGTATVGAAGAGAAKASTAGAGTAGEGTARAGTQGGVMAPPGTTTPAVQAGVREDGVELSRLEHDRKRTDRLLVRTPAPRPFHPSVPPSSRLPSSLPPISPPVPRLACESLAARSPRRLTSSRPIEPPVFSLPDGCASVPGSGIEEGPE